MKGRARKVKGHKRKNESAQRKKWKGAEGKMKRRKMKNERAQRKWKGTKGKTKGRKVPGTWFQELSLTGTRDPGPTITFRKMRTPTAKLVGEKYCVWYWFVNSCKKVWTQLPRTHLVWLRNCLFCLPTHPSWSVRKNPKSGDSYFQDCIHCLSLPCFLLSFNNDPRTIPNCKTFLTLIPGCFSNDFWSIWRCLQNLRVFNPLVKKKLFNRALADVWQSLLLFCHQRTSLAVCLLLFVHVEDSSKSTHA